MNLLSKEFEQRISNYITTTLESHLNMEESKSKMLVHEDVLFDYEHQWNILKKYNPNFGGKLADVKFVKRVQQALESIDVSLHLSNGNTMLWNTLWQLASGGQFRSGIFYTNTNLIVEFSTMSPFNGTASLVRIYTEDKEIDFYYGHFTYDGSNAHGTGPADDKLQECKTKVYKYIHPKIYLDYYMYCASEQDMNELIYSSRLVKLINDLQSMNESYKKEIRELKEQYEKEIHDKRELKKNAVMANEECKKYYYMAIENESSIRILKEKNSNLNDSVRKLNVELDNIKTEKEELNRQLVSRKRNIYVTNLSIVSAVILIFTYIYIHYLYKVLSKL